MVQKYIKQKMCIKHDDVSQYKVFETLCSSNTNCKTVKNSKVTFDK